MRVGDLKKVLDHFDDDDPVLYGWTFRHPTTVSKGTYLGVGAVTVCILDGGDQYGNEVLFEGHPLGDSYQPAVVKPKESA